MDRLESMSILLAAVEAGSLSAASRRLGIPLATVSRRISELEAHLRTRLLNRSSRRLTPTEAGRSYIAACRRILEEVGASLAYFSARGTPQHPAELAAHDCVTFEGLMSPAAWTFTVGRANISVPIHSRLAVNTAEAAVDAAVAGVGITRVLSYQMADALRTGRLAVALQKFEPTPPPVSLVYAGQRPLPLKLRAFLDFAAPRLKTRLAEAASGLPEA